jgi:hypothetical protein
MNDVNFGPRAARIIVDGEWAITQAGCWSEVIDDD